MKLCKRLFMIVDLVALISLWAVLYTVQLQISSREGVALNNFIKNVGIQSIIAALMLFSAYHITNFVKTKTNQKPNSCLLYWHIVNLTVQQIFSVATFVVEQKQLELKQNETDLFVPRLLRYLTQQALIEAKHFVILKNKA